MRILAYILSAPLRLKPEPTATGFVTFRKQEPAKAALTDRSRYYAPELDTLRFGAFMAVFVSHVFPSNAEELVAKGLSPPVAMVIGRMVQAGSFGVDLFFCLSAFLITRLILIEIQQTGVLNVRAFYIRRILRIWPLYIAAVVGIFVVLPIFGVGEFSESRIAAFLLFSGNWWVASGYDGGLASHLWSISVEEHFYLVWPMLIILFGWRRIGVLALTFMLISSVSRIAADILHASPEMRWMNTFLRLEPLAVGAFLAYKLPRDFELSTSARLGFALVGAAIPPVCLMVFGLNTIWDVVTYPMVALACGLILVGVLQPSGGTLLANSATVYLGKISYGLYVIHPLAIYFCAQYEFSRGVMPVVTLAVTITGAAISYRLIEKPFLRMKDRQAKVLSRPA